MRLSDKIFKLLFEESKKKVGVDSNNEPLFVGDKVRLSQKGSELIRKSIEKGDNDEMVLAWRRNKDNYGNILGVDETKGPGVLKINIGGEEEGDVLYSQPKWLMKIGKNE